MDKHVKNSGLTMVELLMTISIIGVLSAVATTQYLDYRREARVAATTKKLTELREAFVGNQEFIANGQYTKPGIIVDIGGMPSQLSNITSQGTYSSFSMYEKSGWRGPYADPSTLWSQDAWGVTFSYGISSRNIRSCGQDMVCLTSDDIIMPF